MQAPSCIGITRGPEHRFEFVNEGLANLVNHTELVGRTTAEAFPELRGQGILEALDQVYTTGESYHGRERLIQLGLGSGQLRDAYFNCLYQRFDEGGQAAGITIYAYEVTELVEARRKLDELLGK
jgi:PAS domain-containing protein